MAQIKLAAVLEMAVTLSTRASKSLGRSPRVHGELLKLGYDICETTIAKYMVRRPGPSAQTWRRSSGITCQMWARSTSSLFTRPRSKSSTSSLFYPLIDDAWSTSMSRLIQRRDQTSRNFAMLRNKFFVESGQLHGSVCHRINESK